MLSIQSKNDCPAETVYADGCVSVCVSLCLMVISRMYTHKHTYTIHIFISIHSVYVYISCCCSMRSCQRDHDSRRAGKWCGKQCCTPPLFMSDGYPIINTSPCRWNTHINLPLQPHLKNTRSFLFSATWLRFVSANAPQFNSVFTQLYSTKAAHYNRLWLWPWWQTVCPQWTLHLRVGSWVSLLPAYPLSF